MKTLIFFSACLMIAAPANATSLVQENKSFEEIVSRADHVAVGKVIEVSMRDKNGKKLDDPRARTEPHSGNVITIHVVFAAGSVLKTTAKNFPMAVSYELWPSLILDLRSMKELVGQSFVILLQGDHFQPHGVAPFDFMWPLDWRQRVLNAIAAEKKESNQQPSKLTPVYRRS